MEEKYPPILVIIYYQCIIFTIINIIINYVFNCTQPLRYASVNDLIMIIMSSVTAALTAYLVSLLIAKHTHIGVFSTAF